MERLFTWRRAVPPCVALTVLPYLLSPQINNFLMAFGVIPVYVAGVATFCRVKRARPVLLCILIGFGAGKVVTFERFLNGGAASARVAAAGAAIALVIFCLACLVHLRARRPDEYRDGAFDAFAGLAGMTVIHWQWLALGPGADNHTLAASIPPFIAVFVMLTSAGLNWGLARDPAQNRRLLLWQIFGGICLIATNIGTETMMRADAPGWSVSANFLTMYILTGCLAHPHFWRLFEPEPPRRRRLQMRWMGPAFALLTTPLLMALFVVRGSTPTVEAGIACFALTGVALWRGSRLMKEREQARREAFADQRFRGLVEHAADVIVVLDADHRVSYVSGGVHDLLARTPEELAGKPISALFDEPSTCLLEQTLSKLPGGASTGLGRDVQVHRQADEQRWVTVNVTDQRGTPSIGGWVLNLHDTTDRRQAEDALTRLALYDPLTGLPNRANLRENMETAVREAPGTTAVLFCDLDGFKPVNDRYGHEAGDEVLRAVAGRWSALLRADDILGRWGGDEFVVVCRGVESVDATRELAERLADSLRAPLQLSVGPVVIGASIGMALHTPGAPASSVLAQADAAMYANKTQRTRTRGSVRH